MRPFIVKVRRVPTLEFTQLTVPKAVADTLVSTHMVLTVEDGKLVYSPINENGVLET